MSKLRISSDSEWRAYELGRWRQAMRMRGLRLWSLDQEHQRALFDAIRPNINVRKQFLSLANQRERIFRFARRAAAAAAMIAVGFFARDLASMTHALPAGLHAFSHQYSVESCEQGLAEADPEGQVQSLYAQCDSAEPTASAQRKLPATPVHTSAQPSTITKSSSLQGKEITGGLSMNMPSPIKIAATAKSIATNGR
jgi:hypothetical protein